MLWGRELGLEAARLEGNPPERGQPGLAAGAEAGQLTVRRGERGLGEPVDPVWALFSGLGEPWGSEGLCREQIRGTG